MRRTAIRGLALLAVTVPAAAGEAQRSFVAVDHVVYPGQPLDNTGTIEVIPRRPLPAETNVARSRSELVGKVASRTILPKQPIPLSFLRDPFLVEAGRPVRVVFREGPIQIEMTGQALGPGSVGDVVRVRNTTTGVTLVGVVSGAAEVMVARK